MKKICFFSTGVLPVPPVKGGAVENLIKLILDENEKCHDTEFSVSSIYDESAVEESKKYNHCLFYFVNIPHLVSALDFLLYSFARLLFKEKALSFRMIFTRLWYMNLSKKYFLRNDFDFIVAENSVTLFRVMKDRRMKKKYGEKFIYHAHNEANSGTFGCRKQVENCPLIITVSDFISHSWKNMFPKGRAEYKCVRNGIDIGLFSQNLSDQEKTDLRKKMNIREDDFVIIFTGRLVESKGILQLARIFVRLPIKNKKLLIVGAAFFESSAKSPIQQKLQAILESCKDDVLFTGYVPYKEIWKYYKISDAACILSIWNDPAPLTNIEAQVSSLPVVTTVSGGIPEYSNPKSRILFPIDDNLEDSVYEKIMWLYENSELRSELGRKNAEFAKQFSIENFYKSFMSALGVIK